MSTFVNLLRADLWRCARSRWPWVVLALVALATLGTAVLTIWLPLEPGLVYDGITGRAGALRLDGRGCSIQLATMVAPFLAAYLSTADSDCGYDRTLHASLRGRVPYLVEKYVLVAVFSFAVLLAYLLFSGVGVLVTARPVANVEPLWQVAAWAGAAWLVGCAYALVTLLVGQLFRSRALAFVAALGLGSALAEQALFSGLLLVSDALGLGWEGAIEAALAWAPVSSLSVIIQGAEALLAVDAAGLSPAVHTLAVCVPLCLACAALGTLVGARRDVT